MKIDEQCCSIELARRLKELGVKQESYFIYAGNIGLIPRFDTDIIRKTSLWEDVEKMIWAAFTVAELGQLLPECLPGDGDLMMWNFMDGDKRIFGVDYCGSAHPACKAEKEADCRAMILIYLIENKLIEVPR